VTDRWTDRPEMSAASRVSPFFNVQKMHIYLIDKPLKTKTLSFFSLNFYLGWLFPFRGNQICHQSTHFPLLNVSQLCVFFPHQHKRENYSTA